MMIIQPSLVLTMNGINIQMIGIRLTRNKHHDQDDIVNIYTGNNSFRIVYIDGREPNVKNEQTRNLKETVIFLEYLFRFLTVDAEPFSTVQINVPSHPIIFINIPNLTNDLVVGIIYTIIGELKQPSINIRSN